MRLVLALPDEPGLAEALDGRLVACYRDTRLVAGDRRARLAGSRPAAEEAAVVHDAARDARALRAVARRRSRRDDVGCGRAVHRPVHAHARARVVRPRRALAVPQRGAPARAGARPCRGRRPRRPLRGRAAGARGRPRAAAPAALLRRPARGGPDLRDGAARRGGDPRRLGRREPARRAPHPDSPAAVRAPDQPVARQPAALVEPGRALVLRAGRALAPALSVRQGRSASSARRSRACRRRPRSGASRRGAGAHARRARLRGDRRRRQADERDAGRRPGDRQDVGHVPRHRRRRRRPELRA